MNAFDSQHSLDYRDDLLETNPFADTPSRSTELNINTSFISSDSEPVAFEAEQEEEESEPEQTQVEQEEIIQQDSVEIHQGETVLSPISTVDQLEQLSLSPSEEAVTETDTQVFFI